MRSRMWTPSVGEAGFASRPGPQGRRGPIGASIWRVVIHCGCLGPWSDAAYALLALTALLFKGDDGRPF
jgi:hypothetical protein